VVGEVGTATVAASRLKEVRMDTVAERR
jgi:hypothetical protein